MSLRLFLTGGTGYIGAAVLDAALKAGYQVSAIARDPEKVDRLNAMGATGILAELATPRRYLDAVRRADLVIHTALEDSPRGPQVDRTFLDQVIPVLSATGRPTTLVYTSGIWVIGNTHAPADETVALDPAEISAWRVAHEQLVLDAATSHLRTVVMRPGIVYGDGRGIIGDILKDALNGLIRVVGSGQNHWPCVYDRDLADAYIRIAQSPDASGIFHVTDEGDERLIDIVDAIAGNLSQRPDVRHVGLEEARAQMGPYADALALDQVVRSPRVRALGWTPTLKSVAGNVARLFEEYRSAHRP